MQVLIIELSLREMTITFCWRGGQPDVAGTPAKIEWLLRADGTARAVPVASRMAMDDEFWNGSIERFNPSDGLRLFLTSAEIHRGFVFDTHQAEPEPWLLGHVPVNGHALLGFSDGVSVDVDPQRSALFLPAERRGIFTLRPQKSLRHAGISVRDDRVRQMFGADLPEAIAGLLGQYGPTRLIEITTGTRLRRLAASLFNERLQGALRLVFMEGVALQILALQASAAGSRNRTTRDLSLRSRRAIEAARERLLADIADPPSIGALAHGAGLSERALNAGFRRLYGGTVYEVLRDERLSHARIALETGATSLKQLAHSVGYSHVSNFSAAFARRYGVPPLRYVRERRPMRRSEEE
jgi:AraC-like DNA-binding protein